MSSVKTYFDQGLYKLKGKQNKKKQNNVKILRAIKFILCTSDKNYSEIL